MNQRSPSERSPFERQVADRIAEQPSSIPLPRAFVHELTAQAGQTGQRPRWLALLKEPPMRSDNHLAVGSPTVRAAMLMAATLLVAALVAGAGVAGQRLLAADAIVVAQDGSGTTTTIAEALELAADGDTILIRPGTYVEAFTISKDIAIEGQGPREAIVIVAPEGGPSFTPGISGIDEYAILVDDASASISGVTLQGGRSRIFLDSAQASLRDLVLSGVGAWLPDSGPGSGAIIAAEDSDLELRDSLLRGSGGVSLDEAAVATIVANRFLDGSGIFLPGGVGTVVEGNDFSGTSQLGIQLGGAADVLIEGNSFSDRDHPIRFWHTSDPDSKARIVRNTIVRAATGINLPRGAAGLVGENRISDSGTAISAPDYAGTIEDNTLDANALAMLLWDGSPTVQGNAVTGGEVGLRFGERATPAMSGNTVCGNTTDVEAPGGFDLSGVEICESPALATAD